MGRGKGAGEPLPFFMATVIVSGWKTRLANMPQNEKQKNPAAVALGRLGGTARLKWTARQRSEAARHAVTVRWEKTKRAKAKRT